MNRKQKTIGWTISLTISAILLVLIVLRLYQYFSAKNSQVPVPQVITNSDLDIVFGPDSARLTVYMYSNYACKFCNKFFEEMADDLEHLAATDRWRLVVKLVGRTSNENTQLALKTAVCVNKYGNYETLHKLFTYNYFVRFAPEFEAMVNDFIDRDYQVAQCILGTEAADYLDGNNQEFERLGFTGTPVFVVGNTYFKGYSSRDAFLKIIDNELNKLKTN